MSTQLKQQPDDPDWKDRYYRALNEFDEKDKKRSEEEGGLYKSILRLIFSYTGVDRNLDQQLTNMRDKLRQETSNGARNKIINPVIRCACSTYDIALATAEPLSRQSCESISKLARMV